LNRASGIYGLLAIFTGHDQSAAEWILNALSLALLIIYLFVYFKSLRIKDALHLLVFSYIYLLDSVTSISLSIFYCVHWFTSKARNISISSTTTQASKAAATIISEIERRQESPEVRDISAQSASLAHETSVTIVIAVFLILARIYFTLVIIGYARQLVQKQNLRSYNGEPKQSLRATIQHFAVRPLESFWTGSSSAPINSFSKEDLAILNSDDFDDN
jgi:hypothetical protein